VEAKPLWSDALSPGAWAGVVVAFSVLAMCAVGLFLYRRAARLRRTRRASKKSTVAPPPRGGRLSLSPRRRTSRLGTPTRVVEFSGVALADSAAVVVQVPPEHEGREGERPRRRSSASGSVLPAFLRK
jgi:hypothetical protein